MNIAIVDDNRAYLDKLSQGIRDWAKKMCVPISISAFASPEIFLAQAEDRFDFDALMFDVSMPSVDGITLARKIREVHPAIPIIFVSDYMQFSPLGYEVNAVRYLNKAADDFPEKLDECLKYVTGLISGVGTLCYTVHTKNTVIQVPCRDILYFEARNHRIHIKTVSHEYTEWKTMQELACVLPDFFVQTSRSYIINIHHCLSVLPNEVVMTGDIHIQLSRTYKNDVTDKFLELK